MYSDVRMLYRHAGRRVDRFLDTAFAFFVRQPTGRFVAIVIAGLAVPWFLMGSTPPGPASQVGPMVEIIAFGLPAGALVFAIARFPRGSERRVLVGYFVVLANLVLAEFAYMYFALAISDPTSFSEPLNRLGAAYLAICTFTTVGSGIDALSDYARVLVMAQGLLGFLTVAVALTMTLSPLSNVGDSRDPA